MYIKYIKFSGIITMTRFLLITLYKQFSDTYCWTGYKMIERYIYRNMWQYYIVWNQMDTNKSHTDIFNNISHNFQLIIS